MRLPELNWFCDELALGFNDAIRDLYSGTLIKIGEYDDRYKFS